MNYITWEYYSSLFNEVDETQFNKLYPRAENLINIYSFSRVSNFVNAYVAEEASSFQKQVYSQIQLTMCDLINLLNNTDSIKDGVTSVSNDGYSESYVTSTRSSKNNDIVSTIRNGLSATGLAGAY